MSNSTALLVRVRRFRLKRAMQECFILRERLADGFEFDRESTGVKARGRLGR